jgi:hypothetical protein
VFDGAYVNSYDDVYVYASFQQDRG